MIDEPALEASSQKRCSIGLGDILATSQTLWNSGKTFAQLVPLFRQTGYSESPFFHRVVEPESVYIGSDFGAPEIL